MKKNKKEATKEFNNNSNKFYYKKIFNKQVLTNLEKNKLNNKINLVSEKKTKDRTGTFNQTDNINLLVSAKYKIYNKIKNNQISLRFLKSDQSKPSLTLVSTSRESMPAVSIVSNVISAGEWITPNNLSRTNNIAATINPQPIISSAKLILLSIYSPRNLLTINPIITPVIAPTKALNSRLYLKPKFINKITTTITNTPTKTDSFSFDGILSNIKDEYLKLSESFASNLASKISILEPQKLLAQASNLGKNLGLEFGDEIGLSKNKLNSNILRLYSFLLVFLNFAGLGNGDGEERHKSKRLFSKTLKILKEFWGTKNQRFFCEVNKKNNKKKI